MDEEVARVYGNKVRIRACGLCWDGDHLLLVNHKGITEGNFWAPPGGGVEFGESIEECLKKEFLEETGFQIEPLKFMFGCEYILKPIHSIELFYEVNIKGGKLKTGADPELQIIEDTRFMAPEEIRQLATKELHGIFNYVESVAGLRQLQGFFRI